MATDYNGDYWAPPGGYTQLNVGDTGVRGIVTRVFNRGSAGYVGGMIGVPGKWKQNFNEGPLTCGIFQFSVLDVPVMPTCGAAVSFDIAQSENGTAYAVNVQPV